MELKNTFEPALLGHIGRTLSCQLKNRFLWTIVDPLSQTCVNICPLYSQITQNNSLKLRIVHDFLIFCATLL